MVRKMAQSGGMEDDLANLSVDQLRRRVRSLEAQLHDAVVMAESARVGRDDFISDMGHEIRTPMNAVIGFCDLLTTAKMDEVSKGYVESIRTAGANLLEILTDRSEVARGIEQPRSGPADSCFLPRSSVFPSEGMEEDQNLTSGPRRFREARILVVDDTEVNRFLVRGILERAGLQVMEASDGEKGVQAAFAELPDLVLMDMHMPVMDGPQAARILRLDPRTSGIPILALTASVEIPSGSDGNWPFDSYLRKPIESSLLLNTLGRYLSSDPGEGMHLAESDEPRLGPRGRDALRTLVRDALDQMGGATRFSVVRAVVVEIELMELDAQAAPEVAAFARQLRLAADSRDVVVLERLFRSALEERK